MRKNGIMFGEKTPKPKLNKKDNRIYVTGSKNTGKSTLADMIAKELQRSGKEVVEVVDNDKEIYVEIKEAK